ncbi:3-mercaptopyruvate sulfurtransferase [Phenylobacterium deserti]|uniref:Sulfurtransferase n=1 Tax=Phenylobacterium deserti TaxID=1914756 RepID=A0A328AF80_9CAUL|nr:3-mercaptopyruvate sulfurtransferase [Phenylobacterium deserti]RAK52064.1 3-mercaptopyruvate sulfurtransferase [Phenylobacterium deserti]
MTDPLVSTHWLAQRIEAGAVQVVDATWYMPNEDGDGRAEHLAGHIPGALFFDIDKIADQRSDLPHMLLSAEAFAEAAGALGLRRDQVTVVYDARGIFSAPRVWWNLRVMGWPEVYVLDGGLKKWREEGRPVETGDVQPAASRLEPRFEPSLVRSVDDVRAAIDEGGTQLVDARAAGRFTGEVPEPRAGLRSGHMPGARNVPWSNLVRADGTLLPADALKTAFETAGVDLGAAIVTTCGSGVSAGTLALGLARLGRFDVAVYDGSWTEWGGRADTPVVTGPA